MADHLGRVLGGRYRLLAPIGSGAYGHVFLADDVRLGRQVAVKVLQPALATDTAFLGRFRTEAKSAASLNHPHICRVFDWGEDEDGPFLVMEYLSGGSLRGLLDSGQRLSAAQATTMGLQAASALDNAHRRGLIHRDIKPANLVFDEESRPRIADFGIARALADATLTEPLGPIPGTARYASPEQAQAKPLDGRSDVYALALVLVEAVTGQVPFGGESSSATLMARVGAPLPISEQLGPLGPVLSRAGTADPADRLDAAALVAALERVARTLPRPRPLPLVSGPGSQVGYAPAAPGRPNPGPPVPARARSIPQSLIPPSLISPSLISRLLTLRSLTAPDPHSWRTGHCWGQLLPEMPIDAGRGLYWSWPSWPPWLASAPFSSNASLFPVTQSPPFETWCQPKR